MLKQIGKVLMTIGIVMLCCFAAGALGYVFLRVLGLAPMLLQGACQ